MLCRKLIQKKPIYDINVRDVIIITLHNYRAVSLFIRQADRIITTIEDSHGNYYPLNVLAIPIVLLIFVAYSEN